MNIGTKVVYKIVTIAFACYDKIVTDKSNNTINYL